MVPSAAVLRADSGSDDVGLACFPWLLIPGVESRWHGLLGRRLEVTDLEESEVRAAIDRIEQVCRELFFEGRRELPLRPQERRAALEAGPTGLLRHLNHREGTWAELADDDLIDAAARDHDGGGLAGGDPAPFVDWVTGAGPGLTYDGQIASAGGGNHFAAELQVITEVVDRAAAHAWGLAPGRVAVMTHSGSLGFGQRAAATGHRLATSAWPRARSQPDLVPLRSGDPSLHRWLGVLHAAVNFAKVNRLALSLVARRALREAVRPPLSRALWDACHNLVWEEPGDQWLHRKGAAPAVAVPPMALLDATGPVAGDGARPVLVPGSMGSSSWLMAGLGSERSLASPFDPTGPAPRSDLVARWRADVAEEAPWQYKEPQAVVRSLTEGEVARPVARLEPIATVKT